MSGLSFGDFASRVRRAEADLAAGRWRAAFDVYASTLRQRIGDLSWEADALTDADFVALERLADIAVPLGETDVADALYTVAAGRPGGGDPQTRVRATVKRVQIALGADRFAEALRHASSLERDLGSLRAIECTDPGLVRWERSRPWASDASGLEVQIYLTMGRLLASSGQYGDAAAFFRRGLYHSARGTARLALQAAAPLLLASAAAALERGAVAEAEGFLAACQPEADRPGDAIRRHELWAGVHALRGRFDEAIESVSAAADGCRRYGFGQAAAGLLLARAKLWLATNRVLEAEADVIEAANAAGGSAGLLDRGVRLLAYARARQEALFGGAPLAVSAAALQLETTPPVRNDGDGERPAIVTARPTDFLGYYEERELDIFIAAAAPDATTRVGARRLLAALLGDFGATDSAYIQARLQLVQGVLDVQARLWRDAEPRCHGAAEVFSALGLPTDEFVARRFESLALEQLDVPPDMLRTVRARSERLLAMLTTPMSAHTRDAYLVNKWSVREAELADCVTRLRDEHAELARLPLLRRSLAALRFTARMAAFHRALVEPNEVPLGARMTAGAVLAAWWELLRHPRDHRSVAFKVLPTGVVRATRGFAYADIDWRPTPRTRVRALVRGFHEGITSGGPDADRRADDQSAELSEVLGVPELVSAFPAHVRRLTIVPDDQLHVYPFAALPAGNGGLVADCFAVTIGVPRSRLNHGRTVRRDVTIAAARGTGRDTLPAAASQVAWLRSWWRDRGREPRVLDGGACDASGLIAALESSAVVHFAGHGEFDAAQPARSGIVVDRADGGASVVGLDRLSAVDASGLHLATLLSCWSGDSFLFPGSWAVSIPSSLCRAGAECVMAPLWEIDDALSSAFVEAACEGLASGTIDENLRRVHVATRLDGNGIARSPLVWASIQIYCAANRPFRPRSLRWSR